MSFQDFIDNLQQKPDHIKNRIFWSTSLVATVLVVGVWFTNFKHQVQDISSSNLLNITQNSNASAPHYLEIENAQTENGKFMLYFATKNDTVDILNFSNASDIALTLDGQRYSPSQVLDRQNQAFAKKILSNSQNFGILVFESVPKNASGTITFDNLYFEQSPDNIFKETADIDLEKLTPPPSISN